MKPRRGASRLLWLGAGLAHGACRLVDLGRWIWPGAGKAWKP